MDSRLQELLARARRGQGLIVALTGAGISAESGIPTFRGKDGYWTVGSAVYHPQELATYSAFCRMPDDVWHWYLYRRTVCRRAQPNAAHHALVTLDRALGDRFRLITQNVDGLHLRAGATAERTYEIHGNIDFMRCADECTPSAWPIPASIGDIARDRPLSPHDLAALRCPRCGARSRPHVLWFDESYDELRYRWTSSIDTARHADLVMIVGTSASTNLPWQVVTVAAQRGAAIVDVNIEQNPFADIAASLESGHVARGPAAELVPAIARALTLAPA